MSFIRILLQTALEPRRFGLH